RRAHLPQFGTRATPKTEEDRLEQIALAGAVHAVDAHEASWDLELQRFLVNPVVLEVQARDPHRYIVCSCARARYSSPSVRIRARSNPMRSWLGSHLAQ